MITGEKSRKKAHDSRLYAKLLVHHTQHPKGGGGRLKLVGLKVGFQSSLRYLLGGEESRGELRRDRWKMLGGTILYMCSA